MRPIELLIRNDDWDAQTQERFFAHLQKPMADNARLGYCERKAWFLARSGKQTKVAQAEKLLSWAIESFPKAKGEAAGLAKATRAQLREQLGKFLEAARDTRESAALVPTLAVGPLHEARALLRANNLVANEQVIRLARAIRADTTSMIMSAYKLWAHFISACCAEAKDDIRRSQAEAQQALLVLEGHIPEFERWVRYHRRAAIPEIDLAPTELDRLIDLSGRPFRRYGKGGKKRART